MVRLVVAALVGAVFAASAREAEWRSLKVGRLTRTYRLYLPEGHADQQGRVPLVLALHGGFGTGRIMERFTMGGFDRLADRDGWIVAYPDGIERHWNDGRSGVRYRAHQQHIDDVGFLVALVDELADKFEADPKRVFVTGASNGAMMCQRLAFERPERFAGMAPVIGSIPEPLQVTQLPPRSMPMMIINGTADPLVPWEGGEITSFGRGIGSVVSVEKAVAIWCKVNRCEDPPVETDLPDKAPDDGCTVTRQDWTPAKGGAPVVLITIEEGGHTWPGGTQYLPERRIGAVCHDVDACDLIWTFFKGLAGDGEPAN